MKERVLTMLYRRILLPVIPIVISLILIELVLNFYTPVELPVSPGALPK